MREVREPCTRRCNVFVLERRHDNARAVSTLALGEHGAVGGDHTGFAVVVDSYAIEEFVAALVRADDGDAVFTRMRAQLADEEIHVVAAAARHGYDHEVGARCSQCAPALGKAAGGAYAPAAQPRGPP